MTHIYFIASPLDQFEIRDLISLDAPILSNLHFSITNITLYLAISFIIVLNVLLLSDNSNKIISNN